MTDVNTIRWGDTQVISIPTSAATPNVVQPTKQLVQAHWGRPITWSVQLSATPTITPGETATFILVYTIIVGCGAAQFPFLVTNSFAPAGGIYSPFNPTTLFLPASDIQVTATLTSNSVTNPGSAMQVSAAAAPFNDQFAMTELAKAFIGPDEWKKRRGDWMPEGFHPEPLEYHRPR